MYLTLNPGPGSVALVLGYLSPVHQGRTGPAEARWVAVSGEMTWARGCACAPGVSLLNFSQLNPIQGVNVLYKHCKYELLICLEECRMHETVYRRSTFYYLYFQLNRDTYMKLVIFAKGIITFGFV